MSDIRDIDAPDCDYVGVQRFAAAMNDKLKKKRESGRGGWNDPTECPLSELRRMLRDHMEKGDMVDIANFSMMIWNRQNPKGKP